MSSLFRNGSGTFTVKFIKIFVIFVLFIETKMTTGNNIETEYLELNSKNEWSALYQRIRSQSQKDGSSCVEAVKPQNKILNRYRDVSPYDHSRIVLQRGSTDYINANLIRVERANRQYILTQGPLSNTYSHFWLMVWEQQTKAIVMLNKLIEKKQDKCFQYWPAKMGAEHIMNLQDVGLTVEYTHLEDHSYYLTRTLRLTDVESGEHRDIFQFHYVTWPDFGVPASPAAFLSFLTRVRDAGALKEDVGPAIVHCSAGIGRSGTFCLVDSCLVLIEKFGLNSIDVKEILLEMRKYRMGLIQTPEQLRFSYQAIIEGAKQLTNQNQTSDHIVETNNHITEDGDSLKTKTGVTTGNSVDANDSSSSEEEDDGPPPLPPPRLDSLLHRRNGELQPDRPLPLIPNSVSDQCLSYEEHENDEEVPYVPSGPLPTVPADEEHSESDEQENEARSESPASGQSDLSNSTQKSSSYEVRQRKRAQRKEHMEAQVRDMKRRQQSNEQWTQLKRPKTSSLRD
nr:unnamed protein product [Callosobruchus analis]